MQMVLIRIVSTEGCTYYDEENTLFRTGVHLVVVPPLLVNL
jgi:hypothetical protein